MKLKSFGIIVALALCALAGLYVYHIYQDREAARAEKLAQAERYQENLQDFEDLLNGLLGSVSEEVAAYKQRRKVLVSLIRPDNLRSPEYVAENNILAESTIMAMQLQMDEIMQQFERADEAFRQLVLEFPQDQHEMMREKWDSVIDEKVDLYATYFDQEQEILAAYKSLLEFYADKREVMSVDVENDKIMFSDPNDHIQEQKIKLRIKEASAKQAEALREENAD